MSSVVETACHPVFFREEESLAARQGTCRRGRDERHGGEVDRDRAPVETEAIADTEGYALEVAAPTGMPDPVFHLMERAMAIAHRAGTDRTGPTSRTRRPQLDAATVAATGLCKLLQARHGITTAHTPAERDAVTGTLVESERVLRRAAGDLAAFFKLAGASRAAGRQGLLPASEIQATANAGQ